MATATECKQRLKEIPEGGRLRSKSGLVTIELLENDKFRWTVGGHESILDLQSAIRRLSKYRPQPFSDMRMEWPDEAWQFDQDAQTKREEFGLATKKSGGEEKKMRQKNNATFYTKPKGGNVGYRGTPSEAMLAKKHNLLVSSDGKGMIHSAWISPGKLHKVAAEQKLLTGKGKQLSGKYDPETKVLTLEREPNEAQAGLLRHAYPGVTRRVSKPKKNSGQ